ncbi:MAG: taurine dioxygenase [Balneolaceae bacterium]|nr:taurine dioxygenase [Balneolaceae bacterium]MBO6546138.1 taurine dioxygenase [Balneolaceae bacterium]MBO6648496.1 taurine dioxygenase [Balneolaceae bacterium]
MLYGEATYIKEFAEAALSSFSEFKENYCEYLKQRDEVNFRKAGHKIKPVAQMLGLEIIIDEYEQAKSLIWDKKEEKELHASCDKMSSICDQVLEELRELSE